VARLRDRLERRHRHASATARLGATRATRFALWALMMLPAIKHRIPRVRDRPRVQLLRCAVGAVDGEGRLDVRGESWAARLDAAGTVRVPLRRLDRLLSGADVEARTAVLKIDIEGAEWDVLSSLEPPLPFAAIVGEFHPRLAPVGADRFFSLFGGFDVRRPTGTDAFTAIRTA
jgi:FkbM family methyltransferase